MHYLSLVFLNYLLSESSGSLVPFIKPCKSDDTECLKASTQIAIPYLGKGFPELGVPPGDSLNFKEINADQGELKLNFRDTKLVGTSKCQVINVERDVKQSTISIEIDCPLLITGLYKLDGKLLFIPAQGDGDFEIKTDKAKIIATYKYKTVNGKNGQKHWKIVGYEYSYHPIERVYIKLQNLFNGDEEKAKPIQDILNKSWKELISEIGTPIIKELIAKTVESIKKFLLAVPTTELELS
ncbi:unnamed protein product [Parnassius apollo]|uniref:(apollo) hypothetical protein n=1 Tax=Parnassius apollo TaxID=110799 RepID=A0A8S3W1P1_PARAO|nr:unnamed protein product [Parnassius apollo]